MESRLNPESENILLVESESWALESGLQFKESRIQLTIGIQNPSSTDKDWNPVSGIQNLRLSWIDLFTVFSQLLAWKKGKIRRNHSKSALRLVELPSLKVIC